MDEVVLDTTKEDGTVVQERVHVNKPSLGLYSRSIVAVSDEIAQLSRVVRLSLDYNAFSEIPRAVLTMTQLTYLNVRRSLPTRVSLTRVGADERQPPGRDSARDLPPECADADLGERAAGRLAKADVFASSTETRSPSCRASSAR